jgi:hypothetical protein
MLLAALGQAWPYEARELLSKADVCATDKRVGLSGASIAKLSSQQVVAVFPDLDADRSYRDLLRLEGIRYDRALVA